MTRSCSKCKASLDAHWDFCPHCGGAGVMDPPQPEPHEKAPAKNVFAGVLLGIFCAPVFIIYGTMMCLLGPPMVFGIPLIILGILAPFVAPFLAITAVRGRCPWCNAKISSLGPLDAFYCNACSQPIEICHRELMRGKDPIAIR